MLPARFAQRTFPDASYLAIKTSASPALVNIVGDGRVPNVAVPTKAPVTYVLPFPSEQTEGFV
jgi:hypothetical protein